MKSLLSIAIKLAAVGDSKEAIKKAVKILRKSVPQEPSEDPRSYNDRLTELARSGEGIYTRYALEMIEELPADCFPSVGKYFFIDWLLTVSSESNTQYQDEPVRLIKDYFVATGHQENTLKGKSWDEVSAEAHEWHNDVDDAFKSDKTGYITDPAKTIILKSGGYEIHEVSSRNCSPEEIENDLLYIGDRMHICVGKVYAKDTISGQYDMYYVRDSTEPNTPRVMISYNNRSKAFEEVKANSNQRVSDPSLVSLISQWFMVNYDIQEYVDAEGRWIINYTDKSIREKLKVMVEEKIPEDEVKTYGTGYDDDYPDYGSLGPERKFKDLKQDLEYIDGFKTEFESLDDDDEKVDFLVEASNKDIRAILSSLVSLLMQNDGVCNEFFARTDVGWNNIMPEIESRRLLKKLSRHYYLANILSEYQIDKIPGVLKPPEKTVFYDGVLEEVNVKSLRTWTNHYLWKEIFKHASPDVIDKHIGKITSGFTMPEYHNDPIPDHLRERFYANVQDKIIDGEFGSPNYYQFYRFLNNTEDCDFVKNDPEKRKEVYRILLFNDYKPEKYGHFHRAAEEAMISSHYYQNLQNQVRKEAKDDGIIGELHYELVRSKYGR